MSSGCHASPTVSSGLCCCCMFRRLLQACSLNLSAESPCKKWQMLPGPDLSTQHLGRGEGTTLSTRLAVQHLRCSPTICPPTVFSCLLRSLLLLPVPCHSELTAQTQQVFLSVAPATTGHAGQHSTVSGDPTVLSQDPDSVRLF